MSAISVVGKGDKNGRSHELMVENSSNISAEEQSWTVKDSTDL